MKKLLKWAKPFIFLLIIICVLTIVIPVTYSYVPQFTKYVFDNIVIVNQEQQQNTLPSFLLNFFVFLIGYFTRNFKAMLSFHNLTLFRNPDAGFAKQIVIDGLGEMLRGWELLCFIPFIVLLLFYLLIRRKVGEVKHYRIRFLFILLLTSLILSTFLFELN